MRDFIDAIKAERRWTGGDSLAQAQEHYTCQIRGLNCLCLLERRSTGCCDSRQVRQPSKTRTRSSAGTPKALGWSDSKPFSRPKARPNQLHFGTSARPTAWLAISDSNFDVERE